MKHSGSCVIVVVAGIVVGMGSTVPAMAEETPSGVVIRRAEAKYEAALKAAEKRLHAAHEQFRQSAAAARKRFLAEVAAARVLSVPSSSPPASPSKPKGKFKNLPVTVPGNSPSLLTEGGDSVWTEIPAIARGAVIFTPPGDARKDGVVKFTVKHDALIGLAASWAYDGNSSGGWQSERKTKQQLVADGWIEVGTMYHALSDRHTLFSRQCKKGEVFRIRTRKYREPYVLIPGYLKNTRPLKQKKVDLKVVVEVLGSKVQPVGAVVAPRQMRAELEGTLVYDSGVSGVAIVRVHRKARIYVAASWAYDGNNSGQWTQERWTKEDFKNHGWKEIGTVRIPHRGHEQQHILFVRDCNKGDRFRLRSRKYGAPFVFAPRTE